LSTFLLCQQREGRENLIVLKLNKQIGQVQEEMLARIEDKATYAKFLRLQAEVTIPQLLREVEEEEAVRCEI